MPEPGGHAPPREDGFADVADPQPLLSSRRVYEGLVWDVRRDEVDLGPGGVVRRDVVDHPGAVAIVAMDEHDQLALVHQYRHPVGLREWEIPAGLLDIDGEAPHLTAARELAEEADLEAADWQVLIDFATSPGFASEALRIYLARDLSPVPVHQRHTRSGEEFAMPCRFIPLDEVYAAAVGSRLANPATLIGVFAAYAARARGWTGLRPADTPWPLWERLRGAPATSPREARD